METAGDSIGQKYPAGSQVTSRVPRAHVDLHPPGAARELLYVSGRLLTHDITVTRITDIRSTRTMIKMVFYLVGRQGVEP